MTRTVKWSVPGAVKTVWMMSVSKRFPPPLKDGSLTASA